MKQKNINEEAQKKRRKDAYNSAIISSLFLLAFGALLLMLALYHQIEGFWGSVLKIVGIIEIVMIIPVWILLKERLKEIEGGEEDVATKY